MLLAFLSLGRDVEEDDSDSDVFKLILLRALPCLWKLSSVLVAKFLALVLAMQVAGHANRLMYRRLRAVGIDAAKAMVVTLGISSCSIADCNSIR